MVLISYYLTLNMIISSLIVQAKYFRDSSFKYKKKEVFIDEILKYGRHHEMHAKQNELTNECLYNEQSAKELLAKFNINKVDVNTRFILGSCNPVIFVPGVFGVRLVIRIKCSEFLQDKQKAFETKYFCGDRICQNSIFHKTDEIEYVIWPSLFETPFMLYEDSGNRNNSCFGYFMNYFNSPDECPQMNSSSTIDNEKYICRHHPAVKITYYGGTNDTKSDSKCGLRAIENIVASGLSFIKDEWVNKGASVGFYGMHTRFVNMGYKPGFSLAGLPFDFRRNIVSNKEFSDNFNYLVENLYNNTGKKVIIVAHSFGNLHILNKLIEIKNNDLFKKIKRLVSIAPPYAGAPKIIEGMTTGTHEFRTVILGLTIDMSIYSQKLYSTTSPSSYDLIIAPQLEKIKGDSFYSHLREALTERIDLENKCQFRNCTNEEISHNSTKFQEIFPFFPKINESYCADEDLNSTKYKDLEDYNRLHGHEIYNAIPTYNKCKFRMFDYENCPVTVYSDNHERDIKIFNNLCGRPSSENDYYVKNYEFEGKKDGEKQCLVDFIKKEGSFGYEDLNSTQGIYETKEEHRKNIQKFFEQKKKNDKISSFPNPDIPTTLIYSSFLNTRTGFLYEKNNNTFIFNSSNIYFHGGDGTVPSISTLFAGFKWAYEKYQNKSKNGIQFVEFCSLLNQDEKFGYKKIKDKISDENEFIALGCDCLNGQTYKLDLFQKTMCSHASMLNDEVLIGFVENIISLEPQYDQISLYNTTTLQALINYNNTEIDYENTCNDKMNK